MPFPEKVHLLISLSLCATAKSQPASKSTAIAIVAASSAESAATVWAAATEKNNKLCKAASPQKQLSFNDFILLK